MTVLFKVIVWNLELLCITFSCIFKETFWHTKIKTCEYAKLTSLINVMALKYAKMLVFADIVSLFSAI